MHRFVIKRGGERAMFDYSQISDHLVMLSKKPPVLAAVNVDDIAMGVVRALPEGRDVTTSQLDEWASDVAAQKVGIHPEYGILAARIQVHNLHRETTDDFVALMKELHATSMPRHFERADDAETLASVSGAGASGAGASSGGTDTDTGAVERVSAPRVSKEMVELAERHKDAIARFVDFERDFLYSYIGFVSVKSKYLLRSSDRRILERPQFMLLRVALFMHGDDIAAAEHTYNLLSTRQYTHATPTLFNAGTVRPACASCFLLRMRGDSIEGIFDTVKQCACISKNAGGVGFAVSDIRATGSFIAGTGGYSNGIVPMLRLFNETARYVDQGGGKRDGSFAAYLEPWHAEIRTFVDLRRNFGEENSRCRNLFLALWVPDLFMRRAEAGGTWSLFSPDRAPGLVDVYGAAFDELYERYEREGRATAVVSAAELLDTFCRVQIETGALYMLYKDACNRGSNQSNRGTIVCSNLCTEIVQFSGPEDVAVCNLSSICLGAFVRNVDDDADPAIGPWFDFDALGDVTATVVRNLNLIIDKGHYPLPEANKSNKQMRPLGIGVQAFADAVAMLGLDYDSTEAAQLNVNIFETMYYAAVRESVRLARAAGPYPAFAGSPASAGKFQFDLTPPPRQDLLTDAAAKVPSWTPGTSLKGAAAWEDLRHEMVTHGLRNSLLLCVMPTATTAHMLDNNEACEPFHTNLFNKKIGAGHFWSANKHMYKELVKHGLVRTDGSPASTAHNEAVRNSIMAADGSVQHLTALPTRSRFRTAWELSQRVILSLAAMRAPFIDQSQSMNLWEPAGLTLEKMRAMHFTGWRLGLKTGLYYLRTRSPGAAMYTVTPLGSSVPGPVVPGPASSTPSSPLASGLSVSGLSVSTPSSPSVSGPAASGPAASGPAASGPSTSGPSTSGPAASGPSTSGPSTQWCTLSDDGVCEMCSS